jgi:hypothetical protein
MNKLCRIIVSILLMISIEEYGFGLGYGGKVVKVKLPEVDRSMADQTNNNNPSHISKPSSGYIPTFWSSSSKNKAAQISPRDQKAIDAVNELQIPTDKQVTLDFNEIEQQQNFLNSSTTIQKKIMNAQPAEQQKLLNSSPTTAKSSGWSLFNFKKELSLDEQLNNTNIPRDTDTTDTESIKSDTSIDFAPDSDFQIPSSSQMSTKPSSSIVTPVVKAPAIQNDSLKSDQPNNIHKTNIAQKRSFFSFNPFKKSNTSNNKTVAVNETVSMVDTNVPAPEPTIRITTQKYKVGEGMMNLPKNESVIEIQQKNNRDIVEKNPEDMTPKELEIYQYKQYKAEQAAAKNLAPKTNSQIPTSQKTLWNS